MRISEHPVLTFAEKKTVKFVFDGKEYYGVEGEPVSCALHANGIRILGHSHDKNRPRGLYCAIGNCSSCLATVNGVSNVRICVEKLKENMIIEMQNGRGRIKL